MLITKLIDLKTLDNSESDNQSNSNILQNKEKLINKYIYLFSLLKRQFIKSDLISANYFLDPAQNMGELYYEEHPNVAVLFASITDAELVSGNLFWT